MMVCVPGCKRSDYLTTKALCAKGPWMKILVCEEESNMTRVEGLLL